MKTLQPIKATLVENRYYFYCYFLCFLAGLVILLGLGKAASFIDLNPLHGSALDTVFICLTFLGDGRFAILICVVYLLMRRWSRACQLISAFLGSALIAQILKYAFSMPRPKQFFPVGQYSYFIDGVTHVGFASFPSGHTTSVFALATLLAVFDNNKKGNVLYLFGAVAVGYSRIYLGQHFLLDVLAGSVVGTITALFFHWLFSTRLRSVRAFARD
ncbi:MAG TPA: phosphatase PAP2 family protein [Puia sp.]|nr:phosphatase PAP2 family protein [Puia sp.]